MAEPFPWNDEHIEELKRLLARGFSSREIAGVLGGGLTRNAVVGKIHRLGLRSLPSEPGAVRLRAKPGPKAKPKPEAPPKPERKPRVERVSRKKEDDGLPPMHLWRERSVAEALAHQGKLLGLEELTDRTCCWPIGDPREPGFGFCGAEARRVGRIAGNPLYCEAHLKRAGDGLSRRAISPMPDAHSLPVAAVRRRAA